MAFTDGTTVVPMISAQDHKRLLDGDDPTRVVWERMHLHRFLQMNYCGKQLKKFYDLRWMDCEMKSANLSVCCMRA